jgi:hypothetical protein
MDFSHIMSNIYHLRLRGCIDCISFSLEFKEAEGFSSLRHPNSRIFDLCHQV